MADSMKKAHEFVMNLAIGKPGYTPEIYVIVCADYIEGGVLLLVASVWCQASMFFSIS